jgi:hypothetical protein
MDWLRKHVVSFFGTGESANERENSRGSVQPRKGARVPADSLLTTCPQAPRPNQGLEWSQKSLRRDADGDEAHEFIICDAKGPDCSQ